MRVSLLLCVVLFTGCTIAVPVSESPPSRGCIYINGHCHRGCEVGTHAYTTGCGYLIPEPTCDNPEPQEDRRGKICDYSACYCDSPTVRSSSGTCIPLSECGNEPKKQTLPEVIPPKRLLKPQGIQNLDEVPETMPPEDIQEPAVPESGSAPVLHPRGCIYIDGICASECEVGTKSYDTGCGFLTPEATCDNPNPQEDRSGSICDFSACYCEAPTVRSSSGACIPLSECANEPKNQTEPEVTPQELLVRPRKGVQNLDEVPETMPPEVGNTQESAVPENGTAPVLYPRGCIYINGVCANECAVGTRAYTTGCGFLTPEPTCDNPNPQEDRSGSICDFSACYCEAPTVRSSSGACIPLSECAKEPKTQAVPETKPPRRLLKPFGDTEHPKEEEQLLITIPMKSHLKPEEIIIRMITTAQKASVDRNINLPVSHPGNCVYVNGICHSQCEPGTHAYTTGCGYLTPEPTCENPNPQEDKRGKLCDFSSCYCDAPTVRSSSGACVPLSECGNEAKNEMKTP